MRREQVKQQVAAPGVAPDYRAIPAEMIEYSDHVRNVGRHVKLRMTTPFGPTVLL